MNWKRLFRPAIALAIAGLSLGIALLLAWAGLGGEVGTKSAGAKIDAFFYDAFYRLRPPQSMQNADVLLVAVDDESLQQLKIDWPIRRRYWGDICRYLDQAGAKVIVFDVVFPNPSPYGDDDEFAAAVNTVKTPIVFGSQVKPNGDWEEFAPAKVNLDEMNARLEDLKPRAGVNFGDDLVYRRYLTEKFGQPSEAEQAVLSTGMDGEQLLKNFPNTGPGFLLHYYGPHLRPDGTQTFPFIRASAVVADYHATTTSTPATKPTLQLDPARFKDKIVILCGIGLGTFDLKSSPLSDEYPGAEIQATAMENLLHNQQVRTAPPSVILFTTAVAALLISLGIVLPRPAAIKIATPILITIALFILCITLFRGGWGGAIWWLSPVKPLTAILIASPLAFGFTYFAEDRQRRFMLKALSKVVSPAVAQQLARDPGRLALGTQRTTLTVLFTDLANFTDLAEGMDVQDLGKLVNRYLGEMSHEVFAHDGTLDKYIGDAVMCFWNAPLPQADHALRACHTALAMLARERQLQSEFAALTKRRIYTRIGINTASAAVGFIGSQHLFNYTALGDGINLASRLEGANKNYGSQILLSQPVADLVRDHFLLRKIDILRVKGKTQPMAVYELLAPKTAESSQDPQLADRIRTYEEAFTLYQSRQWDDAEKILLELCARFGQDEPAGALLQRVKNFRQHPPADDWDGVYESKTK